MEEPPDAPDAPDPPHPPDNCGSIISLVDKSRHVANDIRYESNETALHNVQEDEIYVPDYVLELDNPPSPSPFEPTERTFCPARFGKVDYCEDWGDDDDDSNEQSTAITNNQQRSTAINSNNQ